MSLFTQLYASFFGRTAGALTSTAVPITDHTLRLTQDAAAEEAERIRRMLTYWDAYFGRFAAPLAPIKKKGGVSIDDSVIFSKIRTAVDNDVAFTYGKGVQIELDEDSDTQSPAETWLDACLDFNRFPSLLVKHGLNAAVCGHGFIRVLAPPTPLAEGEYPRLVLLDPATVTVRWQDDDVDTVLRYVIEYPALDDAGKPIRVRTVIARGDGGAFWTIADYRGTPNSGEGGFVQVGETQTWAHTWAPIFHHQNLPLPNEWWGLSDVEGLVGLNRALIFGLSNTRRIEYFQSHQKLWGKGFASQELGTGPDDLPVFQSPDAELNAIAPHTDFAGNLAVDARIDERLHEQARLPQIAAGKLESFGNLSGLALRVLYRPLIDKALTKQLLAGEMLRALCAGLLELGGFGAGLPVMLHWRSALPTDRLQELQAATLELAMGTVSKATIAAEQGRDWEHERALIAQEQADAIAHAAAMTAATTPAQPAQTAAGGA